MTCAAQAQWLNHPTPGIPRTPDGKPNLSAPAPRTAGGKPDLSGVWGMDGASYLANVAADLKPGDVQPWADKLFLEHAGNLSRDDPADLQCLPQGPRANLYTPFIQKIVQTPSLIVILIEDLTHRQVFLDGRELPKDPNPSFMGYSVGHWEGDTLVIESNGYSDRTWLDLGGHPHTEALRITERFKRTSFGKMEIEETIDDPKAFNKPFTIKFGAHYIPDTDLLEYVCAENESDKKHLVGKITDDHPVAVKVATEVLAKYAGTYDFRFPENPTVPILMRFTLSDGVLVMDGFGMKGPLVPISQSTFSSGANPVTFYMNDRGVVTHITMQFAEGDLRADRVTEGK